MPSRTKRNVSTAGFIADHGSVRREPDGRQVDFALVGEEYRQTPGQRVTVTAAVALPAAGATSSTIPVAALGRAIPAGTTLVFDAAAGEYVTLIADALAGATSLTVHPIAAALEGGEVGVVPGAGPKTLRAGTPVASVDATGRIVPRGLGAAVAGRTTLGLLVSDAHEDYGPGRTEALSGYGVYLGAVVYEQLLPQTPSGASVLDATVRAELRDLPGGGFVFKQYSNDAAL